MADTVCYAKCAPANAICSLTKTRFDSIITAWRNTLARGPEVQNLFYQKGDWGRTAIGTKLNLKPTQQARHSRIKPEIHLTNVWSDNMLCGGGLQCADRRLAQESAGSQSRRGAHQSLVQAGRVCLLCHCARRAVVFGIKPSLPAIGASLDLPPVVAFILYLILNALLEGTAILLNFRALQVAPLSLCAPFLG